MIDAKELKQIAKDTGIKHPEIVEREYVNGILVDAMSRILSKDKFSINGGTCRNKAYHGLPGICDDEEKRAYFGQTRFSLDIDAYILPELNERDKLIEILSESNAITMKKFGINLLYDDIKIVHQTGPTVHQFHEPRMDVYIPYKGPMLSGKHNPPRIKLTLDSNEPPILPTVRQMIYHPFSDGTGNDLIGNCLSYVELFGNKLWTMYVRRLAKDLYDVGVLWKMYDIKNNLDNVQKVLDTKSARWHRELPKNMDYSMYVQLFTNWGEQIPKIIKDPMKFDECFENLNKAFMQLERRKARMVVGKIISDGVEKSS